MSILHEQGTLLIGLEHVCNLDDFKDVKPFEIYVPVEPQFPKTNLKFALFDNISILDVRQSGISGFNLEKNGFQFLNHDFKDHLTMNRILSEEGSEIIRSYLEALDPVVKQATNAEKVIFYDWRVSENAAPVF